jgi:hypothetical protein
MAIRQKRLERIARRGERKQAVAGARQEAGLTSPLEQMQFQPFEEEVQPFESAVTKGQQEAIQQMLSGEISPQQMAQVQKAFDVASQRVLETGADIGGVGGGVTSLQQRLGEGFVRDVGALGAQQRQAGLGFAQPFTEFQAQQAQMPFQQRFQQHLLGQQAQQQIGQARFQRGGELAGALLGIPAQIGGVAVGGLIGGAFGGGQQNFAGGSGLGQAFTKGKKAFRRGARQGFAGGTGLDIFSDVEL